MKGIIAKKYVNALLKSCEDSEVLAIEKSIEELSSAFSNSKFKNIISSPDVTSKEKEDFILSLLSLEDKKLINFIKLLASNERLYLIPEILKELKYQNCVKNNSYVGEIISNFEIDKEQVSKLEENFSKKFNANIKLETKLSDYPGVKIELDDLGVEVSFSLDRLKAQMVEHILKAI
ncbi:F0F1 ATP synthase subunit delta [Sulfurospirillum sp. 1307]